MSDIKSITKTKYYYPFLKRIFMKSNWEIIDTKYDIGSYYGGLACGNCKCNIMIVYHEWNDNNNLVARKLIITSNEAIITYHLAESKKFLEALSWLNNPKELLP